MSGCTDRRFEKMLHAYELGMLSNEERQEFELHQLDCDHCFRRAKELREAARLLKWDPLVREWISAKASEQGEEPEGMLSQTSPVAVRRRWPTLIPAALVAAAVTLFVLLKPFSIEFKPTKEAIALGDRLTIMHFRNLAEPGDPHKLGEITSSLLITDLSESRLVQVTSSQRLYDILRSLGKDETEVLGSDLVSQVAKKAGGRWVLTGEILQTQPGYVIISQLSDISTGKMVASQRVEGDSGGSIFSVVDRLTPQVKKALSLPPQAAGEPDRNVADVTTHSPEAYLLYLEGLVLHHKYYNREAAEKFAAAVEKDSTFAMAYYYLATLKDVSFVTKAVEHSANASRKEQHYIRSLEASVSGNVSLAIDELQQIVAHYPDEKEAFLQLGVLYYTLKQWKLAIDNCERAVAIDVLYKQAYNQLAYAYSAAGDLNRAVEAINKYIAIAPDEANPYDTRGDMYANYGKVEAAIESYLLALKIKPDYYVSLKKLGFMYLFTKDYARADSCFRVMTEAASVSDRVIGRYCLPYGPTYQGKFDEAIRMLDDGIEACRLDKVVALPACFHCLKAMIFWERNDRATALREVEMSAGAPPFGWTRGITFGRNLQVQLLAETGDFVQAEKSAEELKADLEAAHQGLVPYWYALGSIELARNDPGRAVTLFEKAAAESPAVSFSVEYMLGRSYLEAGKPAEAAVAFEKLLKTYNEWRHYWTTWAVKTHYYLGLAYERSGRHQEAIGQLQEFIGYWENARPEVKEIAGAKAHLARLRP